MRILISTGLYPPDIGGPATYTSLLERELHKRGIKVEVLSFGSVRDLPKVIRHLVYFLKCVWQSFFSDIVFSQDPVSVGLPSFLASRLVGRKFAVRVSGDYAWEQSFQRFGVKDGIDDFQSRKYGPKVEALRWLEKFVVRQADLVITPSQYFQSIVSRWGPRNKPTVIYNGVDLLWPETANPNKTIVSAGRLVKWKGFDVLIELMADLEGWNLVVIGDGPEYENLKSEIGRLNLEERVQLTGALPKEKLFEHLNKSGVFVLNTSFESFSFVIVEAMSLGIPVIATNIGNLREIIDDGKDGILVEPNNKEQIREAIRRLEEDKGFRQMISRNAKIKAHQFSIEYTADSLLRLFSELLKNAPS